jgi:hypothetical protein
MAEGVVLLELDDGEMEIPFVSKTYPPNSQPRARRSSPTAAGISAAGEVTSDFKMTQTSALSGMRVRSGLTIPSAMSCSPSRVFNALAGQTTSPDG